jgi:hypothetical protein
MKWRKLGRIITPDPGVPWMSAYCGPTFVKALSDRVLRVYMSGRDEQNISGIGTVDLDARDLKTILRVSPQPVFDVGQPGCFDERGVAYPWLVEDGAREMMYYVGWIAGGLAGFFNDSGVAAAPAGTEDFRRVTRAAMLERTDAEPFGTGSACVRREADGWKMWYTSFDRWERHGAGFRHYYCIKYATSADGVRWHRPGTRCIPYRDASEYAIGKPCVLRQPGGRYEMWYSYRGAAYRIGYAVSADGIHWERRDDEAGITVSDSGWDSEMVEYAHVFEHQGRQFMTYNGNRFGQTGVGLAVRE